ncbi:FecR family protein [Dysgonomonas capnocytophagoides]|uniref:FecR family protein n=1 Tax=Dysgonomonas capnocytophagoides TaxID=45254 RepID=UPI00333ED941
MKYFQHIINKFRKEKQSSESIGEFQQWLITPENEDEKEKALWSLWESLPEAGFSSDKTKEALHSVENSLGLHQESPKRSLSMHIWQAAAAVFFIIAVTSVFLLLSERKDSQDLVESYVPNSELQTITLPDGSTVELNSETVLLYPHEFTGNTRSVFLIGEANFKVKKNKKKPFIVKTSNFQVTALGTEFNVASYASDMQTSVTLLSGSVLVENDNHKADNGYILEPGNQFIYNKENNNISLQKEVDIENITAWQRSEIVIRDLTLSQILNLLERKYPITFKYQEENLFNKDTYNFSFRKNASLDEVMTVIEKVVGNINYKLENKYCYLELKR